MLITCHIITWSIYTYLLGGIKPFSSTTVLEYYSILCLRGRIQRIK